MVSSKQNSFDVDDSASPLYSVQPVTVHPPVEELSRPSQNIPLHSNSKAFCVNHENGRGKGAQDDGHSKLHPEKHVDGAFSRNQAPSSAVPGRVAQSSLSKCSRSISTSLEHSFFWYGKTVATYPVLFILLCFAMTAISSIGLITFQTENRPFKLWIPQNSDFIRINEWQQKHFPSKFRFHVAIYEAENVLDKKVLLELLRVHYNVANAIAKVGATITDVASPKNNSVTASEKDDLKRGDVQFKDVCAKLPSIVSSPFFGRKKRDSAGSDIIKEAFMNNLKFALSSNLNRNYESNLNLYDLVIGAHHRPSDKSTIGDFASNLKVNNLALDKQLYEDSPTSNPVIKYQSLPSINVYYEHNKPNLRITNGPDEADKASKTIDNSINIVPIKQKNLELWSVNDLDSQTPIEINERKLNYSQLSVHFFSATKENTSEPLNTFSMSKMEEVSREPSALKFSNARQDRSRRVRRQGGVDWSTLLLLPGSYCSLLEQIDLECFEKSLLEIWGYDKDLLESLSQEEILEAVNNKDSSAIFGYPTNFSDYLGGVTRDAKGRIVGAKVMTHTWLTQINESKIVEGKFIDDFGSGVEVDEDSFKWEEKLVDTLLDASGRPEGINLYVMSAASFGKLSGETIEGDLGYFIFGYMVVFLYVQVMLGKFNCIECRPLLSFLGITAVQMAMVISYGLSSGFGLKYGPVNNILPFLLLGLGIDDMFVIMQAWNNLSTEERSHPLPIRMGYAMQHAGASITVTSATDIVAFAIGGLTVLPALKSFCVYAAIGIAAVFCLQATYFVAWFTLDQRRAESRRNGLICCWKMSSSYSPSACSQRDLCQTFFTDIYSKAILKPAVKVFVLLGTFILFGVSCWGLSNLRQEFNAVWFLPQDSYLYKFFLKKNEFFPSFGDGGVIFFSNVTLHEELSNVGSLINAMESNEYIGGVDSWYSSYKRYYEDQGYIVPDPDITEETFLEDLGTFLYSPSGSRYREKNFKFASPISCTEPAPPVTASSIDFNYKRLSQTHDKIAAMHSVKAIAASSNVSGFVAPYSRIHSSWETDEVIEQELYQNMSLAVLVVFLMTFALIASMVQSLFVLSCVIMTLVDVGGMMHWWGLTIDTVSCVDLVLAIGLCVDYAAHVGHMFMTCYGTRDERVRETLARIGPAVLNGGFSTFLAFCFLAGSNSHVFTTFFKVFFGVCLYGLFHGLVYLPVLLSLVGPKPYARASPKGTEAAAKYTSGAADANGKASPSIEMERRPSNDDRDDPSVQVTSLSQKTPKLNPGSFDDLRQHGKIILPNTAHEGENNVMQVEDIGKRPLSTVNNTRHSGVSNNNSDSNYNSCVSDLEADIDYIDADVDTTSKLLEYNFDNDSKNRRSNDGGFTIVGPNVPIADGEDSDGGMGCPRSKVRRITTNDDDGSGTEV